MSITREQAQKQAVRLVVCPALAPQSAEGKREIIECLMRHAQSPAHAEEIMTTFLETAIDPHNLVAEITAIARQSRQDVTFPPGCSRCTLAPDATTGAPRYASHVPARTQGGYDCAVRCSCERGQALRDRDRQREAELAKEPREGLTPIGGAV